MSKLIDYELQKLIRMLPGYDPFAQAGDCYFDEKAAQYVIDFVEKCCTHVKGELAGTPLLLERWEKAFFANLYGWKRPDGMRRYREAFVFIARGNAKTTLGAAVVNIGLFLDDEPGAELYSAAAEREQARLCFEITAGMIRNEPEMLSRAEILKYAIVVGDKSYKALSAEAGTKHGFNAQLIVIDELHAHKTPELTEVLMTGTGKRRQPLVVHLTTSDYEREGSICNNKHDYASKVRDDVINDPAFLPVIYEVNTQPHKESVQLVDVLGRLDGICSCNTAPTIQTVNLLREVCVRHAILGGTKPTVHPKSGARNTQTDQSGLAGCAQAATNNGCSTTTPSISAKPSPSESSGPPSIATVVIRPGRSGEKSQPTNGRSPHIDGKLSTAYLARSTMACETPKAGDAPSVALPGTYASITAILQAWLEDSSVPRAIQESAYSEILPIICEWHSATCSVQTARLSSGKVLVDIPPDDWTDPMVWEKANPNLGVSVPLEYLERECKRAQIDPAFENTFKRLHLNIRTQQAYRLISMQQWDACAGPVEIPEGALVTIGLDGASTSDMASMVVCYNDGEDYRFEPYYFCPQSQALEMEQRGDHTYVTWANEGLLEMTPGKAIDHRAIRKKLNELATRYDVQEVPFDPWNLRTFAIQVGEEDGIMMVEHRQGTKSMNEPMKLLVRMMLDGHIRHGGHPILRWNMSNLAARQDPDDNIRPDKANSGGKIDGAVGSIMAIGRAASLFEMPSFYETHRVEFSEGSSTS